jgi:hypothetical protein
VPWGALRPGLSLSKSQQVIQRFEYQGIPISVEHRAGNPRQYHDERGNARTGGYAGATATSLARKGPSRSSSGCRDAVSTSREGRQSPIRCPRWLPQDHDPT